jgi:ABC-type multidrug transport system permease subunit
MFYPLDPLPHAFRIVALANPITWQIDVLRYSTIGLGAGGAIAIEATAFVVFTVASFMAAIRALRDAG